MPSLPLFFSDPFISVIPDFFFYLQEWFGDVHVQPSTRHADDGSPEALQDP